MRQKDKTNKFKHSKLSFKIATMFSIGLVSIFQHAYAQTNMPENFPSKELPPDINAIIQSPDYTNGWNSLKDRWEIAENAELKGNQYIHEQELTRTWAESKTQILTMTGNSHIINSTIDSVQVNVGSSMLESDTSTAIGLTIKGGISGKNGFLQLNRGAKAYDTVVENKGSIELRANTESYNTLVKEGGNQIVAYNGYAQNNTIDGGIQTISISSAGAIAEDNLILNGGQQIIYGGTAKNSHIGSGSYQLASGLALDTKVYNGGYQLVFATGKTGAKDTTVYSGGTQRIQSGNADNTIVYGEQIITNESGDWENGTWVGDPSTTWGTNPNATNTRVLNGGVQTIGAYGHAYDTVVDGGTQTVKAYGHIENTTIQNNGNATIEFGGYSTGDLNIVDGSLTMQAGDLHYWTENFGEGAYAENLNLKDEHSNLYIQHNPTTSESIVTVGNLSLDKGRVTFGSKDGSDKNKYSQLKLSNLSGSGTFFMQTDLIQGIGDKVIIEESTSGSHTLLFNDAKTGGHSGTEELEVISFTGDGANNNATFSGKADVGAYVYTVNKVGENWVLSYGQEDPNQPPTPNPGGNNNALPPLTNIAQHSAGLLNTNYLLGHIETQTMMQRMGELRAKQGTNNVWGRIYGGKLDSFNNKRLSSFNTDYSGIQLGVDHSLNMNNGEVYIGVVAGYGKGDVNYLIGSGDTKSYHVGAYSTYTTDSGFYIDGIAKYTYMQNKIKTLSSGGYSINGKGSTNGISVGVEIGQRFYITQPDQGWYAEPQGQLTFSRQSGATINSSNNLRTELDSYDSVLGRASIVMGYEMTKDQNPMNIYFKTGYVKEFDGKTGYTFNYINHETYSFDKGWWDNALGIDMKLADNHQLYAEASYAKGGSFDKKQFNLGYRFNF